MNKALKRHADSIRSGKIDRSNVIGLRKALNAYERRLRGYSVSRTQTIMSDAERQEFESLLASVRPSVSLQLYESGFVMLKNPRYRKQLASVADTIADLQDIKLVGFYRHNGRMLNYTPVYRACDSKGKSFAFYCVPWQSGGNGPRLIHSFPTLASGTYF